MVAVPELPPEAFWPPEPLELHATLKGTTSAVESKRKGETDTEKRRNKQNLRNSGRGRGDGRLSATLTVARLCKSVA
jgi:hypothetical protein